MTDSKDTTTTTKPAKTVEQASNDGTDFSHPGLLGVEVDQTPNENYTVAGQVAGKPTPETDAEQARKAVVKDG